MKPRPFPVRAALYARVSSDHQAEEGTIDSQVEAIRLRAADGVTLDDGEGRYLTRFLPRLLKDLKKAGGPNRDSDP
jgi:DNA invertase Pin-like site-specific DNA recombinase